MPIDFIDIMLTIRHPGLGMLSISEKAILKRSGIVCFSSRITITMG